MARRTALMGIGLLLALLPLARPAAQALNQESSVPRMGIEEFKRGLERGTLVAIDVRTSDAFVAGHIPGARLVPLGEVATKADELRKLGKPIVAYCAWPSENTSARAALILAGIGFKDVAALQGGYTAWIRAGGNVAVGDEKR